MASITKNQVFSAIENLEQQGKTATNTAILAITGGSNATVQKYRKEFYEQRQAQIVKESVILKDTEITVLTDAFAALLKQRISMVQEQYSADLKQLSDSLAEASSELDQLRISEEELTASTKETQERAANVMAEKNLLQTQHEKERKELQAEIQRLNELAYTHKGRADILEERIKQYESK